LSFPDEFWHHAIPWISHQFLSFFGDCSTINKPSFSIRKEQVFRNRIFSNPFKQFKQEKR